VHQRSCLKRLARLFLGQPLRSQPAQFVVDERQMLLGGLWIAVLGGGENAGDFAHRRRRS
jgi:hypothetical protein